jgi:AraC-like DNA-binding protein
MRSVKARYTTSPCRLAELGLVTEGALRMAPLVGLPRLLADQGLDASAVIHEVGCDPALFGDPDNTIDFAAVGRLLVHTAAVTGNPYPGLELGRRSGLGALGPLGQAIRLAADVGTALRALILHFHLHNRSAVPSLWETKTEAVFGYTMYCPDVPGTDHIYDAALAISLNAIAELAGRGWKATEVRLFRDPPPDTEPFHRHFRTRLRFGADHAGIVFPAADLARPLAGADPSAYVLALRKLSDMEAWTDAGLLTNQVRRLLHRLFISGSGPEGIDLRRIARLFALHPRTLNRRLRAEGTTFNALLAETRYAIARQLLRDTRLQTRDIAFILGYAASASFDLAFRRWSGTTATAWRFSHRPR